MLNNISLCGRITNDLELKYTQSGAAVLQFTIAVDRDYSSNGEKQTDFIYCVAWRKTAEFISKYFAKGRLIIVNGSLQVRKYTNKDGQNRTATEVMVDHAYFAGDKGKSTGQQDDNQGGFYGGGDFENFGESDDLPF